MQLIGDATWIAAGGPDPGGRIVLEHVKVGKESMRADLDALFRARWSSITDGERQLVRAMASLGDGPVERAEVARVQVEFTISGFAACIRDLDD